MKGGFAVFQGLLTSWLERTSLFPGKDVHIDLILNAHAGGLKHAGRRRALIDGLLNAPSKVPPPPLWSDRRVRVTSWVTDYAGHEQAILAHLHSQAPTGPGEQRLIVTAGGDGTSRGALMSALSLPLEIRESLLFFRMPLGTGNDAAETRDWNEALEMLSGRGSQIPTVEPLPVIEVSIPGYPVHFSFNIASVGADALVADLTNKLKAWLPGNSYALMTDIAAFFYEVFVRQAPTKIVLTRRGAPALAWEDTFLLAALGASGRRTYGAGKRVLPDQANFCIAASKNLFSKLAYRKPFYEGTHRGLAGVTLASGDTLTIQSPVRLPLQMDGEVLWLEPGDFPLVMAVVDRGLRALRPSPRL